MERGGWGCWSRKVVKRVTDGEMNVGGGGTTTSWCVDCGGAQA